MNAQKLKYRLLCFLLFCYLALAFLFSFTVPPFESPDEVGHFDYVLHLLTNYTLPVQRVGYLGEAHQPPLYYLLAALFATPADFNNPAGSFRPNPEFMWGGRGDDVNASLHGSAETFPFEGRALALHLARSVSVLLGAVTVCLTVLIGWKIFPLNPAIGLLAGMLVAFNPQFLFINASVNNDNLLTTLATMSWWQTFRVFEKPVQRSRWVVLGILIGASFLAKVNGGLVISAVVVLMLFFLSIRSQNLRFFFTTSLIIIALVALISGWWFVRNHFLYGDPFGWKVYKKVFAVNLRNTPLQWHDVKEFFRVQSRSFWGVFGWMNVHPPAWFYRFFGIIVLAGVVGAVWRLFRHMIGREAWSRKEGVSLLLLLLICALQEAYMLTVITQCNASCYQGRYFFPAIAPFALLLSWGILGFLPFSFKNSTIPLTAIGILLFSVALFVPLRVIGPAYRTITLPKWRLWLIDYKANYLFNDMIFLKGYDIEHKTDRVLVTLYWEAKRQPDFNYSAFVHLIDSADQIVTQKDHAPGETEGYPPVAWQPGDILADVHELVLPSQLPSGVYRLRVGLYNWETGAQLPVTLNGQPVGTWIILDQTIRR